MNDISDELRSIHSKIDTHHKSPPADLQLDVILEPIKDIQMGLRNLEISDQSTKKEISTLRAVMSNPVSMICGVHPSKNTFPYEPHIKTDDPTKRNTVGRKPTDTKETRQDMSKGSRLTALDRLRRDRERNKSRDTSPESNKSLSGKSSLTSITYTKKIPDYSPKPQANQIEKIPAKLPVMTTLSTSTGKVDPFQLPSVKAAKLKGAPISIFEHHKSSLVNVNKEILIAIITWLEKNKEYEWTEISEKISKILEKYRKEISKAEDLFTSILSMNDGDGAYYYCKALLEISSYYQ